MEKKKLKALAIHRRLTGRDPETGLPVNQADAAAGTVRYNRNSGQVRQDFQSGMTGNPQSALGVTMGDVTVTPMDAAGAPARTTDAAPGNSRAASGNAGWDAGSAAVWAGTIVPSLQAGHTTALSPQYDPAASDIISGRARQAAGEATKRLDEAPSRPQSDTGRVETGVTGVRAEQAFSDEAHRRREAADMTIAGQLRRARQRLAQLQLQSAERARQLAEENREEFATGGGLFSTLGQAQASQARREVDDVMNALSHSIAEVEEQIRLLESKKFNDEHAGGGWDAVRRFGHSAGQAFMDEGLNTLTFGAEDAKDAGTRLRINRKIERGEALTPEEEDALADEMETQQVEARVGDLGNAYTWGQISGASPWFMAQFLGTGGGFASLGRGLGTRLARKLAERGARRAALEGGESMGMRLAEGGLMRFARQGGRKAFSRLAAEQGRLGAASIAATRMLGVGATALAVRAPLMASTVQSGQTASKVIETKLGPVVADEATGELRYEDAKGWGEAAWQAGMDQVIENASEMGLMNPLGLKSSDVARLVGARRLTAMLLRSTREGAGTVLSKTAELMRRGGLQGYMEEVGEEYSGQLWRTMLGLESAYTTDETGKRVNLLATGDFHGDIWAGLALSMGMTAGTAAATGYGVRGAGALQDAVCRRRMAHRVETASAAASAAFGEDQWEAMRLAIDATDNADFGRLAEQVAADTEMNDGQKSAVMDYMEHAMQMRGDGLRRYVEQRNGMAQAASSPEEREAAQAWSDGYEATEAGEMQDVRRELDFQRTRLAGLMGLASAEEVDAAVGADAVGFAGAAAVGWRAPGGGGAVPGSAFSEAAMDYAVARMAYEGMIRRVQDDIEVRVRESDAQVRRRTNPATGAVQQATLKVKDAVAGDRKAYVVGGTVVMLADGSGVDTQASDASIAILDGETGKVEMVSPDALLRVEEPVDAATLRAESAAQIRQELSQAAADRIDGVLHFNAGDRYVLTGADGRQVEAVVTADAAGVVENGDGTVNVTTDGGQTVAPVAKADLQAMSDATVTGRVAGFEARRSERNARQEADRSHAYEQNEEVTVRDADGNPVTGFVTDPDWNDGTVLVQLDTPEGPRVFPYTREELDRARVESAAQAGDQTEEVSEQAAQNKEYAQFVDHGFVSDDTLSRIADKIFRGEQLSLEEESMRRGASERVEELLESRAVKERVRTMAGRDIAPMEGSVTSGARLSDEVDENGMRFVLSPDGQTSFGEIRKESGLSPAPIKLSEGYNDENGRGYGLIHIEENHGDQIRKAGFRSVEDFVSYVALNYDEDNIRVGKRRHDGSQTFLIQITDTHDNTLFIELSKDGSYWNVNSAGIFRKGYSNKKETVAKTEPQQPNNAVSIGSSLSERGNNRGITLSEPNGEPSVSVSKDSDNLSAAPNPGDEIVPAAPGDIHVAPTGGAYEKKNASGGSSDIDPEPAGIQNGTAPLQGTLHEGKDSENVGEVLDVAGDSLSLPERTNEANDGTTVPEPVSQGEHRAEAPQDARMEEAAAQLRARVEAADRDAQASGGTLSGRQPQEIEQRAAESYAKENGLWIPMSETFAWHPLPSGNENNVYLNTEYGYVYKVNNLMHSKGIVPLFDRIRLHNQIFPESRYEFVGFTGFDGGSVYPVFRQEYVNEGVPATPEEIGSYMGSLGFTPSGEAEYSNGNITISDLRPRNVLKDAEGDLYVIDADFRQDAGETLQADGGPLQEPLQAGVSGVSALERIPKDEQGQPLYEQADPDTAWDAILEEAGGDEAMAQNVAASMVADREAELKKAEKAKPKGGTTIAEKIAAERERKAVVEQAQANLAAWQKIAQTPERRKQAALLEQRKAAEEAARLRREQEEKERAEREEAERIRREALNGVPDFVEDTPQDARARGYRRVNGEKVDRQQVLVPLNVDAALAEANAQFNEELRRYSEGEMDKNEMFHLGRPDGVMRMFLPDLPIVMRQRIMTKGSAKKHNIEPSALENMPQHLSEPIFVFRRTDSVLGVLTAMKDRDGKNVCVAISLSQSIQDGKDVLEVNDIRSIHGRNEADVIYPIVQNNTLVWADKGKGLAWLSSASQSVQQEIDKQDLVSAAKVVESFENPVVSDGENGGRDGEAFPPPAAPDVAGAGVINGAPTSGYSPVAILGREVQVKFDDKNIPTGHVSLIDASQLQPSHINGQRNPLHFIDEAQPKERKDDASVMSAQKIAANIRPEEITSSVTAYTGAPTVNTRGEVIQGNNRSAALREMWAAYPEQAAKYKQYLTEHAADFGLAPEDVEAMRQPVLVNMLDVPDEEAIALGQFVAQDTESGGTERIKPKNLVQKMGKDMGVFANRLLASPDEESSFAELVDSNGADVLKWMQQKGYITPTQYKSAFDSKGNLTAEAKNDLKGVMYQGIFQNGSTTLEEMFGTLPAKAQKAILATAYRDYDSPNTERMNGEIQSSIQAYYALAQDPAFAEAKNYKEARQAAGLWARQLYFDDVTGESYLPSERYSNFALLLATMYKGQSQTFIQNIFKNIYDLVQGTLETTLFETPDNTPRTLVEAINETLSGLGEELLLNGNFIYNGQQRSNVLAGGSATSQQGRQGGDGSATSGGRDEGGTRTAFGDDGASNDGNSGRSGRAGGENQARTEEEEPAEERLSREEAAEIIADMEERAEVAPEMELTIENWDVLFGNDGRVNTPIGEVKMGENQFAKLMRKGRNGKLGMIKPTLEDPDIIVEDKREAKDGANTERDSSYVFVKAFIKNDGSRYYYFTSVTVSQDGKEVVVSNQEKSRNRVLRLMLEGSVIWRTPKDAATSSAEKQGLDYAHPNEAEDATKGSGITPQSTSSVHKDTDKSSVTQTIGEKVAKAEDETATNPTEAQKEAGNYKKGHVRIGQFDITVENPKGIVRSGVDANGKPWKQTMRNTYGYIRGTEGVDGDHIDVFLTNDIDDWNGRRVYIVDQYNEDGTFDEHKVMLGFNDEAEAQDAYLANYEKGWENKRKLVMSSANLEDFEKWINSSHRKTKPFAEYKSVKKDGAQQGENEADTAFKKAVDDLGRIEKEWNEKLLDYVYEHYPTQATITAETTSPKGLEEREAMKKDPVLKKMREDAQHAIEMADEEVTKAYNQLDDVLFRKAQEGHSLVAVHNLSADKLKQAFGLGGFPMPSIAITKADVGHTEFGEISLLFDKESINPSDRRNKVYGEDAWTPTFPSVGYKLDEKKTSDIYRRANKAGSLPLFNPTEFHPDNYERHINGLGTESLLEHFKDDYGAKQLYLSERGNAVTEFEKHEVEKYPANKISLYEKLLEEIGFERLTQGVDDALKEEVKRIIESHDGIDFSRMKPFRTKVRVDNAVRHAVDYAEQGNLTTENDIEATKREIDGRIDSGAFVKWLEDLFSGVVKKKGIRNDKDLFTPSGSSRKWEQLYDEVTLDNVVRLMKKQSARGGTGLFNGSIFGASQEEYKSIAEIRKAAKERIRSVSHEEYERNREAITGRLSSIRIPGVGQNFSDTMDMSENILEAVSRSHTPKGIYRYLHSIYPGMTMDLAQEIADIVKDIQQMSARYFEAKPYRAVGLDEVRLAVVPSDTDAEILSRFRGLGIPVRIYERGNEPERRRLVSEGTEELNLRFRESEMKAENERFNEELQQQIDGVLPKGHVYELGNPSDVLLSAGLPDLPIEMAASRLSDKSIQENHPFELSELKDLPQAVQNPLAVFRSATHIGSYVVMTEIEHNGKNYVVAIQANRKNGRIVVNSIRSVHYRSSNAHMANWIEEGLLEYADKKRMAEWLSKQRYNSADVRKLFNHATKIVESFENPVVSEENQRNGNGALTDDDLSTANDPVSKLTGKSTRTARQRRAFAERERGRMVERVRELAETLHLDNVDIVTDASGLQGARSRAKGFFSRSTGRITIVIPNHTSVFDAEQTLLHEAVAHYGLRELFGEHFDTFLDNVFRNADEEVRGRIEGMAQKHGVDTRTATEEYLASLAEDTNFENTNASWWQKIKELFLRMLHKIGFEDFSGVTLSDNELRYILWRSYENLAEPGRYRSILGESADVAKQSELKVGNYAPRHADVGRVAEVSSNERLESVNRRFNEELDEFSVEEADKFYFDLGMPSSELLAAGIENRPIRLHGSKVAKKMRKHGFESYELKDLPMAVAHPVAVFDNLGRNGNRSILTELKTSNGNFLITIDLGRGSEADFDIVSSVFGKNSKGVVDWMNKGKMRYVDKEKALNYLHLAAPIAAASDNQELVSAANIVRNFENPVVSGEENVGSASESGGVPGEPGFDASEGVEDSDVLFRQGDTDMEAAVEGEARRLYEEAVKDTGRRNLVGALAWTAAHLGSKDARVRFRHKFSESYFDYTRSVKALQDAVEKSSGREVRDFEDTWRAMNAKSSVDEVEIQEVMFRYVEPLTKHIGRMLRGRELDGKALDMDALERYLISKHGAERNALMAGREAERLAGVRMERWRKGEVRRLVEKEGYTYDEARAIVEEEALQKEETLRAEAGREARRDYAGLTALYGEEAGKGDVDALEAAASAYCGRFEAAVGAEQAEELWRLVRALNGFSLRKAYLSGLISKRQFDEVSGMYRYYVPLRGWKDDYSGDIYQYVSRAEGSAVRQKVLRRAYGRKSRAANLVGTMSAMANTAVVQGNRNLVAQRFLNMAMNHGDTGLFKVAPLWYELRADGTWEPSLPKITEGMTAEEAERAIAEHEEKMEAAEAEGLARRSGDARGGGKGRPVADAMGMHMAKWQEREHMVRAVRNGREYAVYVLGDPKAAQAVNGLLNPDVEATAIEEVLMKFLRFKAQMQTSFSPEFMVSNFQRDVLTSTAGTYIKHGVDWARLYAGNLWRVLPMTPGKGGVPTGGIFTLVRKWRRGKLDASDEVERLFGEFVHGGGMTGISQLDDATVWQRRAERQVRRAGHGRVRNAPGEAARGFMRAVEEVNRGVENATRFAAYMTARQRGLNVTEAIAEAKEVSVNFNRKGSGAWGNLWMRRNIIYANAALQSLYMLGTWYGASPRRFMGVMGATLAASVATAMVWYLVGGGDGDDEGNDWYGLSEWNRYNYINLRGPEGYFHWNIPQELRPAWALGQIAFDLSTGRITQERALHSMAMQLNNVTPVSFIAGGTDTGDSWITSGIKAWTPTVLSDFIDAYAWNKDFLGRRITGRTEWNTTSPEWQRVTEETPEWAVSASRGWNRLTGGRDNRKSWWDSEWLNPGALYYIMQQQAGGMGQLVTKTTKMVEQWRSPDEEVEARYVPFVSKFYVTTGDDYSKHRVLNDRFYQLWREYELAEHEVKANARDLREGRMTREEYDEALRQMRDDGSLGLFERIYSEGLDLDYDHLLENTRENPDDKAAREMLTRLKRHVLEVCGPGQAGGADF